MVAAWVLVCVQLVPFREYPTGHAYETLALLDEVLMHWVPERVDPVGQL